MSGYYYENELERDCVDLADMYGYEHRKLDVGPGGKSWIDHAFWGPNGDHFLVEFKIGTNKLGRSGQKGQAVRFYRLRELGHAIYEVRALQHFKEILHERTGIRPTD